MKKIKEDDGAGLVEYGVLVAFIAVLVVFAVNTFGGTLSNWFSTFGTPLG